ncbi:MAG: AMP-binding protein [Planctomycetota bacterium]
MVRSIAQILFHAAGNHPDLPAFKEGGDGRVWTYGELAQAVRETALGLATLGVSSGDRVGLLADNSIHWIMCDLAVLALGAADVPRGTDTPPGEVDYLIRHSGARVVILGNRGLLEELSRVLAEIPELQYIVLQEGSEREGDPRPVLSLEEVRERGRGQIARGARIEPLLEKIQAADMATIVYTSGTTGKPKGVVLSHDNILHNIRVVPDVVEFVSTDTFLSILPAWHMFERLIEYAAISKNCLTTYTSRRTFRKDLLRERPTVLAAVPRVYELLHDEVRRRLAEGAPLRRLLVSSLLRGSSLYQTSRLTDPVTGAPVHSWAWIMRPVHFLGERLLFRKIRAALGGRLKVLVSGGGSLPKHVDQFFDVVGMTLLNGYGLTETAPLISVRQRSSPKLGTVGPPIPGTDVEIRHHEDGHTLPAGGIGILHVRGPQVMGGYYKDPEASRAALDSRGYFNTGDLARIYPTGDLEITGRAKDTIVLRGGDNVEPEPIENALRLSLLIDQVLVVGQDRKQLGALIVLSESSSAKRLAGKGDAGSPPGGPALEGIRGKIRDEMDRLLSRTNGFKPYEQIRRFHLMDRPFSVSAGELTETLKLRRHIITSRYADVIDSLYAE